MSDETPLIPGATVRTYRVDPRELGRRMLAQMADEDSAPWGKCYDCSEPYPIGSIDGPLVLAHPYERDMFCSAVCESSFRASLL